MNFNPENVLTVNIAYTFGAYRVTEPNWDGGDVVMKDDYDALLALYRAKCAEQPLVPNPQND